MPIILPALSAAVPHTERERTVVDVQLTAQFVGDRVWTVDNLDEAIGEDDAWRRYEIVDGLLIVRPLETVAHQLVLTNLAIAMHDLTPSGYTALSGLGIGLGRSYRVPDVNVVANRVFHTDDNIILPADVLLIAEVESPATVTTDRVTKPAQYASAGIEHYWRVETNPLRLHAYRLVGDVYEQTGEWGADEIAHIEQPFTVEIELSSLLP